MFKNDQRELKNCQKKSKVVKNGQKWQKIVKNDKNGKNGKTMVKFFQ